MVARSLVELACSTGLMMGSTMLIKELVLPKMRFSMPDIIYGFKALMRSLRAAAYDPQSTGHASPADIRKLRPHTR
jgi:hypothetical protein